MVIFVIYTNVVIPLCCIWRSWNEHVIYLFMYLEMLSVRRLRAEQLARARVGGGII